MITQAGEVSLLLFPCIYGNSDRILVWFFKQIVMSNFQDTDNFQDIFINDVPMMDVRAPVEFNNGAFPHTINVPLLDDKQREEVGKKYKDAGQDEAIALGLKLSTPEMREQRLSNWKKFVQEHPEGYLYCFRGGLRSRTSQAWLKEQGIDYPLIKGGYKAMRTYLLQQLEETVSTTPFVILSGLTGSGKTRVLKKTRYHVDLEGLADHKGSAFGRNVHDTQPTPINWENQLSIACLQHRHQHPRAGILLEDEGKLIGRLLIPPVFHQKMVVSPRIFLQRPLEERIAIIREDYFADNWPQYQQKYGAQAEQYFSEFLLGSLSRIQKRLGGERYRLIHAAFKKALTHLFESGEFTLFDEGIHLLLMEYYDPMYQYQLEKKPRDVVFQGSEAEILEWTEEHLKTFSDQVNGADHKMGLA